MVTLRRVKGNTPAAVSLPISACSLRISVRMSEKTDHPALWNGGIVEITREQLIAW